MLGRSRWISLLLVMVLGTLGLGASALADSGSEQDFLSAINSTRSSNGLGSLSMDSGLRSYARSHTADMIASGSIYHSSSGELESAAGSGWSKLGENVGRGGTVSSLHQAFMDSAGHRANLLGDYNHVGIGTDTSDGVLYVTIVFMKKGSAEPTPTTTTTTAPQTTTSTDAPEPDNEPEDEPGEQPERESETRPKQTTTTTAPTTTTTLPPTTTTTLIVGPDKPVTPGESCYAATRYWWLCHD